MATRSLVVSRGYRAPMRVVSTPAKQPLSAGRKFLDAFGEKGGVWFAQGKSFDEAQELYVAELKADKEKLAEEKKQLLRQIAQQRNRFKNALGDSGTAKFAEAISLPGNRSK